MFFKYLKYSFLIIFILLLLLIVIFYLFFLPKHPKYNVVWSDEHSKSADIILSWNIVEISNIRDYKYFSTWYIQNYISGSYNLEDIYSMYILTSPFALDWKIAHTFMSFWFSWDIYSWNNYIWVSVEARRQEWEIYSPFLWMIRNYNLFYVISTEEDLIRSRVEMNWEDVRMVKMDLSKNDIANIFIDVLEEANFINNIPEFYNTILNNCTTKIVKHINNSTKYNLWFSHKIIIPWYFDSFLNDNALLKYNWLFYTDKFLVKYNKEDISKDLPFSYLIRK